MPSCKDCKHSAPFEPDVKTPAAEAMVVCLRYPPVITLDGNTGFPLVKKEWKCGEYADNKATASARIAANARPL